MLPDLLIIVNSFYFFSPHVMLRYKFDDERVTKEGAKRALEEQFGGEEEVSSI